MQKEKIFDQKEKTASVLCIFFLRNPQTLENKIKIRKRFSDPFLNDAINAGEYGTDSI
ncbi:MAG: hypothetical protein MR908_08100 [Firmicutes bacterium]|nr:hypothetical protein [Bacillota bacterium]